MAQMVKHLSTMWDTYVWSLGREDPLEKEMAIHSSTVAWKIPWTEEPGRLQSMRSQRVRHNWATKTCTFTHSLWCSKLSIADLNLPIENRLFVLINSVSPVSSDLSRLYFYNLHVLVYTPCHLNVFVFQPSKSFKDYLKYLISPVNNKMCFVLIDSFFSIFIALHCCCFIVLTL